MSLTPQDNSRSTFSQSQPPRNAFQAQPNLPNLPAPLPSQQQQQQQQQQQRASFSRPTQGGIRPQHKSPYTTPYTPANVQGQAGAPRQNGIQNGGLGVSAEQQIAQGVLSNPSSASGSNTPQRRPPPLGTTIHMPPHGAPQNQPMNIQTVQNQSMSVNHAMNPTSSMSQNQRSQNGSPLLAGMGAQRPVMNASPANSAMSRTQDGSPHDTQDLSMIDPQLAIDQQLTADPDDSMDNSMLVQQPNEDTPPIIQGDMLSAPPGGSYPTFDALFAHAQSHALAHGYAFVIGRSKRDNRGLKKVFLICDRGGTNKEKVPGEQRQRKTKSRKCGCEFGVFGLETKTAWILRGRIDGEHLTHNHPPSESPTEHPGARKLDPKAIAAVKALEENGVSVKETLEILHRENPTVRYLPRDIYNARAAIKRDPSRVEATAMEQLPTFYKKPPMTFEEKLRAELRTEVANAQAETEKTKEECRKEIEDLKEQLRDKDKMIRKFEMFIDICNERVMVQRVRLEGEPSDSVPS
ncbi:PKS-NRPS hybrid synthetase [Lachnellula subtilissima]|uniref:PKS-NRPS hybrid synthetase n=1 Tax=Lachnellula subtilissima TaxID=602034 RepID=A0A8H8REJ3_9HELO|nr:PKS-NRPS hybrid synthetase [Lachnellula subtilissima]